MKGLDGLLKCDAHNESFNTPTEFYEHEREKQHTHPNTTTLCTDCFAAGIKEHCEVDPTDMHKGRPTGRCPDCQDKLEKHVEKKIKEREKHG